MKNSGKPDLIKNILLMTLICSGLTLSASLPASAARNENDSDQQRWEQHEKQQRQAGFRQGKHTQQEQAVRKVHRPDQVVTEHRTPSRDFVRDGKRELQRNDRGYGYPTSRTVNRPVVTRERTVVRSVSRPEHRSEVRDYRRPYKIERPTLRHIPRREVIVNVLPRDSRTVIINRERLHYYGGRYYRHTPRGYLVVRPPIGALIADLPFGFLRVTFGGLDYFVRDNVFYRQTPLGYRVVETPVGYEESDYGPARVEAALLNIRTGPGLGFGVIGRLGQGDLLLVTAVTPDWYYVLLPNGAYGWVMSRHTSLIARG